MSCCFVNGVRRWTLLLCCLRGKITKKDQNDAALAKKKKNIKHKLSLQNFLHFDVGTLIIPLSNGIYKPYL
jgi:hypothetical protein